MVILRSEEDGSYSYEFAWPIIEESPFCLELVGHVVLSVLVLGHNRPQYLFWDD